MPIRPRRYAWRFKPVVPRRPCKRAPGIELPRTSRPDRLPSIVPHLGGPHVLRPAGPSSGRVSSARSSKLAPRCGLRVQVERRWRAVREPGQRGLRPLRHDCRTSKDGTGRTGSNALTPHPVPGRTGQPHAAPGPEGTERKRAAPVHPLHPDARPPWCSPLLDERRAGSRRWTRAAMSRRAGETSRAPPHREPPACGENTIEPADHPCGASCKKGELQC